MSLRCPKCKNEVNERVPGVWPFCSARCKSADLGAWLREEYLIPGKQHDLEALNELEQRQVDQQAEDSGQADERRYFEEE